MVVPSRDARCSSLAIAPALGDSAAPHHRTWTAERLGDVSAPGLTASDTGTADRISTSGGPLVRARSRASPRTPSVDPRSRLGAHRGTAVLFGRAGVERSVSDRLELHVTRTRGGAPSPSPSCPCPDSAITWPSCRAWLQLWPTRTAARMSTAPRDVQRG
jgi:hypothetical protein